MGTSPGLGVSEADSKMRTLAFVLLAAAAINAEAEADAYTIGQLAYDLTNSGVITGVDYNNGVVSGYGAIGHHPITHVAGVHPINTVSGVYNVHHTVVTPAVHSVYGGVYGKSEAEAEREAEAEADPVLYTNNLVHHSGVGHVAEVYNSYPVSTVAGVYSTHAVPSLYSNVYTGGFGKREAVGAYGKREVGWCYRKREAGGVYRKREVGHLYGKREDGHLYGKREDGHLYGKRGVHYGK